MSLPTVKLLQYNVLFAKDAQPTPWEERSAALRDWIAHLDPDVITLQEITQGTRADNGKQVDNAKNVPEPQVTCVLAVFQLYFSIDKSRGNI